MYPPHHLGGYELSCRDVVERWRARGHDVTVLTTDHRVPGVADERETGVRRELTFYWRDHRITSPSLRETISMERRNHEALNRALDETHPDVVSAWHMGAMSLGLLTTVVERGIPLVLVVCDHWMVYGPEVDRWSRLASRPVAGPILRSLTRLPGHPDLREATVCFVSEWIQGRARERSPFDPRRTAVVPSGIDPSDFPAASEEARPWRWRLLCVGRVEERKGVHIAIEALAKLPSASLVVCGPADATYLARLESRAGELGVRDRVTFTSASRDELAKIYADADVFLFPVLWDEPFGLTPLEAMACGTPVAGTVEGGSREFMTDRSNCLAVPPGDPDALAAAIELLGRDDALRAKLVAGGYATARELTVDRYAEALERWHEAAAGRFALEG